MLTKEQKWMNRLKKCLLEMPTDCELMVDLVASGQSEVTLLEAGTMEVLDDHMFLSVPEDSIKASSFLIKRVSACSENI